MTTDATPNRNDPLHALDAVEPAGNWDDVVSRSTDGEVLELAPVAARRSFPRPLLAAAAVLAVVALAGGVFALTRGDDKTQTLATDMPEGRVAAPNIWNSTWKLVALERDGQPEEVATLGEREPQLAFTESGAGGVNYEACNSGRGTATMTGDRLVVTEFAMTSDACAVDDQGSANANSFMDQEKFVTELLVDQPTIAIEAADGETGDGSGAGFDGYGIGDRLILTTSKGSATFERTEIGGPIDSGTDGDQPHALWGRLWDVVKITDRGTRKDFMDLAGDLIRLDATTTGRLSFSGCNGSGGTFDLDEGRLKVIEIGPSTAMGCEQDLMDQDNWLQAFLEAEPAVTIDGNHLTLATDLATIELEAADVTVGRPIEPGDLDGSVSSPPQPPGSAVDPGDLTTIEPEDPEASVPPFDPDADPAALWGQTWNVVTITDGGTPRALIDPAGDSPLRLEATTADATGATGQAVFNGCNGAGGTFDLDGNGLFLMEVLDTSTMGRCLSDGLMAQEAWLQAFLEASPIVDVDGDNLTLTTGSATIELVAA